MRPTLKPLAYVLILLLTGAAAAGSYILFTQASFGPCSIGAPVLATSDVVPVGQQPACQNYLYAFAGAPLAAGRSSLVAGHLSEDVQLCCGLRGSGGVALAAVLCAGAGTDDEQDPEDLGEVGCLV